MAYADVQIGSGLTGHIVFREYIDWQTACAPRTGCVVEIAPPPRSAPDPESFHPDPWTHFNSSCIVNKNEDGILLELAIKVEGGSVLII